MKIIKFSVIALCIFVSLPLSYASELDKPYSPTRKEWLEISIFKVIKDNIDAWDRRLSSIVWVKEKEQTIFITLTLANGEEIINKNSEKIYIERIKNAVEDLIREYDWANSMSVFVQFI